MTTRALHAVIILLVPIDFVVLDSFTSGKTFYVRLFMGMMTLSLTRSTT
ncbi:hypothetical protein [cyanobacterium endosymbiont of Epithemia turgida]|nr:hypothetical protein [cyanobacterium endosymbiont of Epithemia turgida]